MVYSGGPYISFGTITNLGESIGPINIPYSRLTDALDLILAETAEYNSYVPWEWWFDYTGALQVAQTRGTDKSGTVTLEAAIHIGRSTKSSSSRQTSQRVRTVGRGESAEQDQNTSDWWDKTTEMVNVGTFYEKLDVEKELSDKNKADIWAQIILEQEAPLRQEITVVLENDSYTVNDFDVGDTVTVTDPDVNLNGKYRVKTIEKNINSNGETTIVTLSNVRTDISDRLADFAKTLEKMQHSSTYIDVMYAEGSRQQQLNANVIEDVWEQTASNKNVIELPEEEDDTKELTLCTAVDGSGDTDLNFTCDKNMFEVWATGVNGQGAIYLEIPLVKFDRNPRFTCEFLIDVANIGGHSTTVWATGDCAWIGMGRFALCGGADPDNPNKYCCDPPVPTYFFGFWIEKSASTYDLCANLYTDKDYLGVKVASLSANVKYTIEARVEWKEKVVKFYWGRSDAEDYDALWGFKLRAILPISTLADGTIELCPFLTAFDNAGGGVSKQDLYLYSYKSQAIRVPEM